MDAKEARKITKKKENGREKKEMKTKEDRKKKEKEERKSWEKKAINEIEPQRKGAIKKIEQQIAEAAREGETQISLILITAENNVAYEFQELKIRKRKFQAENLMKEFKKKGFKITYKVTYKERTIFDRPILYPEEIEGWEIRATIDW